MIKNAVRKPLAAFSDKILRILLACGAGMIWFIWLWGLCMPALTAGTALGGLLWLLSRQFIKQRTQRKEQQLRIGIGGELALDRLLLLPQNEAVVQASEWLADRLPLHFTQAVPNGMTGKNDQQKILFCLIAQHESQTITVQQIIEAARNAISLNAECCYLCVTAPVSTEGKRFAAGCVPAIHLIERAELQQLAGTRSPATDQQLRQYAKTKHRLVDRRKWADRILNIQNSRRCLFYGIGMLLLALWTKNWFYAFPAACCLTLYAATKIRSYLQNRKQS